MYRRWLWRSPVNIENLFFLFVIVYTLCVFVYVCAHVCVCVGRLVCVQVSVKYMLLARTYVHVCVCFCLSAWHIYHAFSALTVFSFFFSHTVSHCLSRLFVPPSLPLLLFPPFYIIVLFEMLIGIVLLHSCTGHNFYVHSFNLFIQVQHIKCKCEQECQSECVLKVNKLILYWNSMFL